MDQEAELMRLLRKTGWQGDSPGERVRGVHAVSRVTSRGASVRTPDDATAMTLRAVLERMCWFNARIDAGESSAPR